MGSHASSKIILGWDPCDDVSDIKNAMHQITAAHADFVCMPIATAARQAKYDSVIRTDGELAPLSKDDVLIYPSEWDSQTVGKTSTYLNLDAQSDSAIKIAEKALLQELSWTEHLGLPVTMLSSPSRSSVNYANVINNHLASHTACQYWLKVPLTETRKSNLPNKPESAEGVLEDTWQSWNQFRVLCSGSPKLVVALELTADLPSDEDLNRWLGEPVKAVIVPTHIFLLNANGVPVLSKRHQYFVAQLLKLQPQLLLQGPIKHPRGLDVYMQYLNLLCQRQRKEAQLLDDHAQGYQDVLQAPLQPLKDNLPAGTYAVFEKDPVKYVQYEKAIFHALLDQAKESNKDSTSIVMVVGAGRGPLVKSALNAAQKAERKIKVYAVEKNENAVITLQERQAREWGDLVTVIGCDMREWEAPVKCDIMVSELLGSCGDNELSPECLDGAQRYLKEGGISIPSSYTSYFAPVMTPKLHCEIDHIKEGAPQHPFDVPYVVFLHNVYQIAPPKPMLTFTHPNRELHSNDRYVCESFSSSLPATVHGLAGYFDTVLYKDITLSIHPEHPSEDMFSWFPIFFPINPPVPVTANQEITVGFWRKSDAHKVWYEWCLTQPTATAIHNAGAKAYSIGL